MDLAGDSHAELLRISVPDVDWLLGALERMGFELSVMHIYERPL